MTSRKKDKTATQSTSGASGRLKKGQTTLTSAWDKKGTGSDSPVVQSPNTSLATTDINMNVTMMDNTMTATNTTDMIMTPDPCLSPENRPSLDKEQCSPLKKRMKAADTIPTTLPMHNTPPPTETDSNNITTLSQSSSPPKAATTNNTKPSMTVTTSQQRKVLEHLRQPTKDQ
jgi:hypothetical protein